MWSPPPPPKQTFLGSIWISDGAGKGLHYLLLLHVKIFKSRNAILMENMVKWTCPNWWGPSVQNKNKIKKPNIFFW